MWFFSVGTARIESPNESNSAAEDSNEDRDGKKNDVQTTMDFAANIEKVKEVMFACSNSFAIFLLNISILIQLFYYTHSMDGIGARFPVKQLKKFCRMNRMEVLLCVIAPMITTFSH